MEEDLKISQMPSVTTSTGEEMIPVAIPGSGGSANSNGKLTLAQVVEKSQEGMVSEETWDAERRQFNLYGYINATNSQYLDNSEYRRTGLLPLNKVLPIKVVGFGTKIVAAVTFLDANGNIIKNIPYEDTHAIETIIVNTTDFPPDAAFFSCSTWVNKLSESSYSNSTSSECKENATAGAIQKSKQALFDDMWIEAGYCLSNRHTSIDRINHPDAPYICNDIPCTYVEAQRIYEFKDMPWLSWNSNGWSINGITLKTNLFPISRIVGANICCYGGKIDYFRVARDDNYGSASACIDTIVLPDCIKVLGWIQQVNKTNFEACSRLTTVKIYSLQYNLDLSVCSKLDLASFQIMVTNAKNNSAITVTVHPTVYAKLTDTSNTEWHAVLTAAVAKNISFATNA